MGFKCGERFCEFVVASFAVRKPVPVFLIFAINWRKANAVGCVQEAHSFRRLVDERSGTGSRGHALEVRESTSDTNATQKCSAVELPRFLLHQITQSSKNCLVLVSAYCLPANEGLSTISSTMVRRPLPRFSARATMPAISVSSAYVTSRPSA